MGKLVESTLVSLDGVIEAPQGWAIFGEDSKAIALENLAGYEAFVLGRASYEMFYAAWSQLHGDPYIDAINARRKYVLSTTLVTVDWNAELLRGIDELASRKDQTDGTLIKYGTGALTRGLLEHRLIDEFQLAISPVVVGHGKRLFADVGPAMPRLELINSTSLASGVVMTSYLPQYGEK